MHIVWINEVGDFTGGCERYMLDCVKLLREKYQVESTLLYAVEGKNNIKFLKLFDSAYPMVDLPRQIMEIAPDLIYVQRLDGKKPVQELIKTKVPVLRFFHDHKLFCLREHKYTTLQQETCTKPIGKCCFPCLGFVGKQSGFPYVKMNSLQKMRAEQKANMRLAKIVVGSEYMRDHLLAHKFPKDKLMVNHLFSNKEPEANKKNEKNMFLFVGQIVRGKGIDILLKAWAQVETILELVICGSGAQEEEFKLLAHELGIGDKVKWTGRITQEELADYYRKAICLLMPSRSPETFGLTGLEAMSYGTAVIATDVGGISTWLDDDKNGILVPSNKVEELAEAIKKMLNNPELAEKYGKQGLQDYTEKFTPDLHIDKLYKLFCDETGRQ